MNERELMEIAEELQQAAMKLKKMAQKGQMNQRYGGNPYYPQGGSIRFREGDSGGYNGSSGGGSMNQRNWEGEGGYGMVSDPRYW